MKNESWKDCVDHMSEITAAIEQGAAYEALKATWPGLTKGLYNIGLMYAAGNLTKQYFPGRDVIKTARDIKLFREVIASGVFDIPSAQANGFTKEAVELLLQSSRPKFSYAGFWSTGDALLTTVPDELLSQINTCAHFIRTVFKPSEIRYRSCSSYGLKHAVEQFTRLAQNLGCADHYQYISNVSFILAGILNGIRTVKNSSGINADFYMQPKSNSIIRFSTGGYLR